VRAPDFRFNRQPSLKAQIPQIIDHAGFAVLRHGTTSIGRFLSYISDYKKRWPFAAFHNEAIFSRHASPGKRIFEISLMPRYTGWFVMNPAKVSPLYFPVIYSNNVLKQLIIN